MNQMLGQTMHQRLTKNKKLFILFQLSMIGTMIPSDSQTSSTDLPEVQLDNLNEADMSNDSEMFPDIKPSDLEISVSIEEPEIINNNSNEDIWKA
ncbi:MAG: hypothetical protein V8R01_07510 [Bacilli bacterium]